MAENPSEILMTDDGHPIGELVVAEGNPVVPARSDSSIVEENRHELLRSEAQELTGNPDADAAVAELYPGYGDGDKRKRAMELVVTIGKSIDEAAKDVGVPGRTVSMWAYNGQWDTLVRREITVRQAQSVMDLARLRSDRRLEIAKEQLDQAKKLRDKAADAVLGGDVSIKSGTEAWAAAAKIEHTLTGVSEAGTIADVEGKDSSKKDEQSGKTPFVFVFQNGLPPSRKEIIDV